MMKFGVKKKILIILVLFFYGQAILNNNLIVAYGLNSNSSIYEVTEDNYNETMKNIVEPYISSKLECGYFKGENDISIYYEKYTIANSKANIVISHGFTENLEKYNELIYYFLNEGYNVFALEHRGHGRSGNLGEADNSQMNVESFDYYIDDLKIYMDNVVVPNSEEKKLFLFAHSMGGAIGTGFLEENIDYFDAAILSSPMLKINTGIMPEFLAEFISDIAMFLECGNKYIIGQNSYKELSMEQSNTTTSLNRYEYYNEYVKNNERFQKGGASFQWLNESVKRTIQMRMKENVEKISIPLLLFQATDDSYVDKAGQDEFAKYSKNCTVEKIENSKHEIFVENDEIQKPYLEKVLKFYNDNI